jgi:hypothetical protein
MKRIIVFIGLCLASAQGFAQGFTVAHDTTYASVNGTADVHNGITNTSNLSNLDITWEGTLYAPSGWSVTGICDLVNGSSNGNCYPWPLSNPIVSLTILPGLSADFKVSVSNTAAANNSVCYFSLLIKSTGLPNKTIWYKMTKDPLGVNTINRVNDAVVIFPNPARDVVNISIDPSLGAKTMVISNLIGRTIGSYNVITGVQKIDMDNAPTGLYFLRVFDNQGKLLETKKFTHL